MSWANESHNKQRTKKSVGTSNNTSIQLPSKTFKYVKNKITVSDQ